MRTTIANELRDISTFGERIYQAFTAPANTTLPYCTFKITTDNPSPNNKCGALGGVEFYIYTSPASFTLSDELAIAIRNMFDGVQLDTSDSPARQFTLEYDFTTSDVEDEGKFVRRVSFKYPLAR